MEKNGNEDDKKWNLALAIEAQAIGFAHASSGNAVHNSAIFLFASKCSKVLGAHNSLFNINRRLLKNHYCRPNDS